MNLHQHPANIARHDGRTFGQRVADGVTAAFGSWAFIIAQTVVVAAWIALNITALVQHWDPYPFILLNLAFSTQAAYAAPLILLAQNRQEEHDRVKAEHDYEVNQEALDLLRRIASGEITLAVAQIRMAEELGNLNDELRS